MQCPKCREAMEIVRFDEIDIDRCTGCRGLWFDGRELKKLKDRPGVEVIDTGDAAVGRKQNENDHINCPRCTTRMVRLVDSDQPHIWYEACSVCGGAYFDAGEFRDFVRWSPLDFFRSLFRRPRA